MDVSTLNPINQQIVYESDAIRMRTMWNVIFVSGCVSKPKMLSVEWDLDF